MDRRLKMEKNILQVRLNWDLPNKDIGNNIIYLQRLACPFPPPLDPITHDWDDAFANTQVATTLTATVNHILPHLSQDVGLIGADWTWNEALDVGPLHIGNVPTPGGEHIGGTASQAMPIGDALAVRFRTGLGGRARHGRIFLPGIPVTAGTVDNTSVLTAGYVTALLPDLTSWLNAVNNNDCVLDAGDIVRLVVASFVVAGAARLSALTTPVVSADLSDSFLDFQRRRAPGHARHK